MYLIGWFVVGAFLGWSLTAVVRELPRVGTISALGNAILAFGFFLGLLLFFGWLAIGTDQAILSNRLLVVKSFFLGSRFEAFALGLVVGRLTFLWRVSLLRMSQRLGTAVLGDKDNTAWAFQSAIAILVVLTVIFAFRPDFFDYLRSFKVGGFEATFADRSSTAVREATLHLNDLKEQLTLEEYRDFRASYLDPKSARGLARKLFGQKELEKETGEITATLFDTYVNPIIVSLVCLNSKRAIVTATHDYDLVSYSAAWEDLLLSLHGGTATLDANQIRPFLQRLRSLATAVATRASGIAPECIGKAADQSLKDAFAGEKLTGEKRVAFEKRNSETLDKHARDIGKYYKNAIGVLQKDGKAKPEILALMVMESYLVGAAGDLIALISGQREKAVFLTKMVDKFPHSEEFVTPGIINLFYQLTDARVNSPGLWPVERTLSDLNYAIRGADLMMSRSADWMVQHAGAKSSGKDEEKLVLEIFDIFLRNLLVTLTTKLQFFNQIELTKESLSDSARQEWIDALSRALAIMKARLKAAIVLPERLPLASLDQLSISRLPLAKIEQDFILDADLAISLSVILIEGTRSSPSALSCNTSLYFLNDATDRAKTVVQEKGLDTAQEIRWKQLVSVIAQRTADSCAWRETTGTKSVAP
jgi:hypothetical protein